MGQLVFINHSSPIVFTGYTGQRLHDFAPLAPDIEFLLNKRWCVEMIFSFKPGASTTNNSRTLRTLYCTAHSLKNTKPLVNTLKYTNKMYFVFRSPSYYYGSILASVSDTDQNYASFEATTEKLYRNTPLRSSLKFGVSVEHSFHDEITTLEQFRVSYMEI